MIDAGARQGPLRPARRPATSLTFLADEASAKARYHLVLAADVFVYVDDLRRCCDRRGAVLAPDGLFAFTRRDP